MARSGPELVTLTGIRGGQNGVAGAVRDFRNNVAEALLEQQGLVCGPQDVICSGGPGYRLNEWIEVKCAQDLPADQTIENGEGDDVQVRRDQIIAEIRSGRSVRAPAIAKAIRCSLRTVKRDLDALKAEGAVAFDGPSKIRRYSVKE